MKIINEILKKYNLNPYRYEKKGKATIVDTNSGRFVLKERSNNEKIFNYLKSRSFNYYPTDLSEGNDDYEITEYIDELEMPNEQKMIDLIKLVSLLHSKTTYYKEIDYDDYKKIYEDIKNNIEYLNSYYNDIITMIESHVYMSPSEYLFASNISKVFGSLNFCEKEIDQWYNLVKNKTKQRSVILHNNLDLSHFFKNEKSYLVSWSKSKIGMPIFDLYILYKRHVLDFDFSEILKEYEKGYPLKEDERKLFFVLISLPNKLEFNNTEYNITKEVSKEIEKIYRTEHFILPYYTKQNEQQPQP